MRNIAIAILMIGFIGTSVISHKQHKEITHLRMLKTHFYDFRERIYYTVPVDYLSKVTIGDFDFDKYLED